MPRYLQRQAQANPSFAPTSFGPFEKEDRNFALTVPPVVHDVFHSSGELLDPATREFMESRFRRDFSWVRVHNDARAAEATDSLNAVAYAGNSDIVFGPGQYQPGSSDGRRLLAHELTHVLQQQAGVGFKNGMGEVDDAYEKHADGVADLVVSGKPAAPLLEQMGGSSEKPGEKGSRAGTHQSAVPMVVQRQAKPAQTTSQAADIPGLHGAMAKFAALNQIKEPMMRAIAKEYLHRPGKIEMADRIVQDTPYGGEKVIPGIHDPSEDRVVEALMSATDLKKIGKGDKATDWSFQWIGESGPVQKTAGQQQFELGKFFAEQGASKAIDQRYSVPGSPHLIEKPYIRKQLMWSALEKSAANLGVVGAESLMTGEISPNSVAEAITEPVARWFMKDVLLVSAEVITKTIPIIGWVWLAYDISELLSSLRKPAETELRPYQSENARIIDSVRAYLERKEEAAWLNEAVQHPFDPSKGLKPLQSDRLH